MVFWLFLMSWDNFSILADVWLHLFNAVLRFNLPLFDMITEVCDGKSVACCFKELSVFCRAAIISEICLIHSANGSATVSRLRVAFS